ncbi:hypothetical protein Dimus_004130 [Dionaea muscipula]
MVRGGRTGSFDDSMGLPWPVLGRNAGPQALSTVEMSTSADGDTACGSPLPQVSSSEVACIDADPRSLLSSDGGGIGILQRRASVLFEDATDAYGCLVEGSAGLGTGLVGLETGHLS